MNVLIVDDEPLAREGMRMLLGEEAGITSVAEARHGIEAVSMIRAGTSRSRASVRTSLLSRWPMGSRSAPPSPYFVKYPIVSSLRFPVPATR